MLYDDIEDFAMAIAFRYKPVKARQLAAGFLRLAPGKAMNYTKLIKLMYIADREHILETGFPITGDDYFALPKGPILSDVLNCIRGERRDSDWDRHFRTNGYDIKMINDPGSDELSRFDEDLITAIFVRYEHNQYGNLINDTHNFPEWIANKPGEICRAHLISPEDILSAGGKTLDEIAGIAELAAETLDLEFCLIEE
jgi:uncharacterized phage-associated protein